MTVACNRLRQSTYTLDTNGGTIYEEWEVEGYQIGLSPVAILDLAQNPDSGTAAPTYGELRDGLPCRYLQVRLIAANKARVIAYFGYVPVSFGGTITRRFAGAFGRKERIEIPVFRETTVDPAGALYQYRYMPEYDTVPVAARWYDGRPVADQSQEPTREQVFAAINQNMNLVRNFPDMPMQLVDWEFAETLGQPSRVRLRFEIRVPIPEFPANALGGTHVPIPALPPGGRYRFDPLPEINTAPTINVQTAEDRFGSWQQLPFRVQMDDGTYIQ